MPQETGYLILITIFFVALPIAADVFVFWRLTHSRTNLAQTPTRMVFGYLALATNFSAIAIVWGTFYCNVWLSNHSAGTVVGGARSIDVALILALWSLIFGFVAPKGIRSISAFAGLYVCITMIIVSASAGVL